MKAVGAIARDFAIFFTVLLATRIIAQMILSRHFGLPALPHSILTENAIQALLIAIGRVLLLGKSK